LDDQVMRPLAGTWQSPEYVDTSIVVRGLRVSAAWWRAGRGCGSAAVEPGDGDRHWPVFKEVPDESGNSQVTLPAAPGNSTSQFTPDKTAKIPQMQMQMSG
jgi:hypothetical protein